MIDYDSVKSVQMFVRVPEQFRRQLQQHCPLLPPTFLLVIKYHGTSNGRCGGTYAVMSVSSIPSVFAGRT